MMKQLITYIFLLWVCAGCVHSVDERLICVNSLADSGEPDSAMILLQSIEKSNLNEHNSRYYDLMTIKTRDKAYMDITNDSLIVDLINYFEDEGSIAEKAEAYYYGGRVYREMGDLPQSLDYFQKALDVLADDDSSARLKGKISSQMGQMFFDLQMYDQAIPKFHIAVGYNIMFCDTINVVYNYRAIGDIYYKKCNADSTIIYLGKALDIATEIKNSPKYEIEIRNSIVDCHIKFGNYNLARNEYTKLDSIKSTHNDYNADYLVCTAINMSIINRDYNQTEQLAKQLSGSSSVHSRWFAYGILKDIAKQKKQETELYKYMGEYEKCIDSINAYASREAVVHQNSFYNYTLREKENIRLNAKNHYVYSILMFIILVFVVLLFFYYYKESRLKLKLTIALSNIKKIKDTQISENIITQTVNTPTIQIREQILSEIGRITNGVDIKNYIIPKQILSSNVYDKFKIVSSNVYSEKLSETDWEELDLLVNRTHKDFKMKLNLLNSNIKDTEYRVCLLLKCHFSNPEISKLIHKSYSGVISIQKRLYHKIFFTEGSATDFEKVILCL